MQLISTADRFAIEDLITRYSFTWDTADEDGFADLWTKDAECFFYLSGSPEPSTHLVGESSFGEAVRTRAGYFKKIGLITKHFMPNTIIEPITADSVRSRSQALITWQMPNHDPAPKPVQAGYYDSDIIKRDDVWKFQARRVYLNGLFRVKDVYGDGA